MNTTTCNHYSMTLINTIGLGSFAAREVYRCDCCGAKIEAPVENDDLDGTEE